MKIQQIQIKPTYTILTITKKQLYLIKDNYKHIK
jgi:hypothetical protein